MRARILQHLIDYWFEPETELCDTDIEHIEECIKGGYKEGELYQTLQNEKNEETGEARGWWKIITG